MIAWKLKLSVVVVWWRNAPRKFYAETTDCGWQGKRHRALTNPVAPLKSKTARSEILSLFSQSSLLWLGNFTISSWWLWLKSRSSNLLKSCNNHDMLFPDNLKAMCDVRRLVVKMYLNENCFHDLEICYLNVSVWDAYCKYYCWRR